MDMKRVELMEEMKADVMAEMMRKGINEPFINAFRLNMNDMIQTIKQQQEECERSKSFVENLRVVHFVELQREKATVKQQQSFIHDLENMVDHLHNLLADAGAEGERYKEALEFYAEPDNHKDNVTDQWEPVRPITRDSGEIARQALEGGGG